MNNKYIAYYRVSTKSQEQSGLGLEAQEETVKQYCLSNNCNLIASYTEIETSTKDTLDNRPILQRALGHCKRIGARLIIAKLDRLARSVYVTALLHKSGIEFLACDMPLANKFTIQILAAVAEQEARSISERTKSALKALKARGVKLGSSRVGSPQLSEASKQLGRKAGAMANHNEKKEAYADLLPEIFEMRKQGMYLKDIAFTLNDKGYTTRTGCTFHKITVARLLRMAA